MLTEEQDQLDRMVRRLPVDRSLARKCAEGGPTVDVDLLSQLADLGLLNISIPTDMDGAGLGLTEE